MIEVPTLNEVIDIGKKINSNANEWRNVALETIQALKESRAVTEQMMSLTSNALEVIDYWKARAHTVESMIVKESWKHG